MHRALVRGIIVVCALAAVAVGAVAAGLVLGAGPRVLVVPADNAHRAVFDEAWAIEDAFVHAFDNLSQGMSDEEIMLAASWALRPAGGFSGDCELVICQVGVREERGELVTSLKVKYELRDAEFAIERELSRSAVLAKGAGKNA